MTRLDAETDTRFTQMHYAVVSGELPVPIRQLVKRCEVNAEDFDNEDMSLALKFGELLWRRLTKLVEHYERQAENFMPGDSRAGMMKSAARDMRFVLSDCARDL